jgi:Fic family protein
MFTPKFTYTNDIVNDLVSIERYKTQLEYLYLPTRTKQEMIYKAKMKKTHFSTSIEGNVLSYDQVERVITEKGKKTKIDAEREVINYWDALSYLEKCREEERTIDNQLILELHGIIERRDIRKKIR